MVKYAKIFSQEHKRIKSVHNHLTLHARIYVHCQNHLVTLNCGESILNQYHILTKEDLKSSTAILDPNKPGSTTLKLSWIWHSSKWLILNDNAIPGSIATPKVSRTAESIPEAGPHPVIDPVTLYECMLFSFFHTSLSYLEIFLVK